MAKVTYDVSGVGDLPDREQAPVGIYRGEVVACEPQESAKGNQMLKCQWRLTHDATGKKLKTVYGDIWDYPILDHDNEFVQHRLKEFIAAMGLKAKGAIDTDKIVGKKAQLKLKSDTDQDGEYRPRIGKIMPLAKAEEAEPEDEEEPEDEDVEPEEDDEDEEALDLDELSRTELKALIKEEGLEIKVLKSMSDDDIRAAIAEAMEAEDEEDEEEPEDEDAEDEEEGEDEEDDGYDDMSPADLKAELKERELPTSGAKKVLIQRLRADDGDGPF